MFVEIGLGLRNNLLFNLNSTHSYYKCSHFIEIIKNIIHGQVIEDGDGRD